MGTGKIVDEWEKKTFWAASIICIIQAILAVPTGLLGFYAFPNNFWLSFTFVALENLLAEGWRSPTISMLISVVPPEMRGGASAVYLLVLTVMGTISNPVLGAIQSAFDAQHNPAYYGSITGFSVAIASALSIPFYFLAGREYKKWKETP